MPAPATRVLGGDRRGAAPRARHRVAGTSAGLCPGTSVTFEAVFFEGSPDVLFNYADTTFGGSCASPTAAARPRSASRRHVTGRQRSASTAELGSGTAVLWTTTAVGAGGHGWLFIHVESRFSNKGSFRSRQADHV